MNDPFEDDDEDSVVIPFVLTKKHGGEYDTEAFCAGWHLALLDARLTIASATDMIVPPVLLRTKWKAQADLIAMSHSMLVRTISTEDPEYLLFIFGATEYFQEPDE